MTRFSPKTLAFIGSAARQKKPEWLDRNRAEYESVLVAPVRHLVETLARELKREAAAYHFPTRGFARIKRPAHRAQAQGLYKDWIGVQIARDSGSLFEDLPSLYFHLSEKDIFSAGGLYLASSTQVRKIRAWIANDASRLQRLFEDSAFRALFKDLGDERKLKTFPRDYPKDHSRIEWLRLTGYYVWKPTPKKVLYSTEFPAILAAEWRQILRLNAVLDHYLARPVPDTRGGSEDPKPVKLYKPDWD